MYSGTMTNYELRVREAMRELRVRTTELHELRRQVNRLAETIGLPAGGRILDVPQAAECLIAELRAKVAANESASAAGGGEPPQAIAAATAVGSEPGDQFNAAALRGFQSAAGPPGRSPRRRVVFSFDERSYDSLEKLKRQGYTFKEISLASPGGEVKTIYLPTNRPFPHASA